LDGFPGVHSNRWLAGTTSERNQALLAKLSPTDSRNAQFRSVLCFYDPQTKHTHFFEGIIKGSLATAERGSRLEGFGYDPIFIPEGYAQTFAELGVAVKNQISHRRQALLKLNQFLLTNTHLAQPE
jgi:XTP/dITP diphosphohydrolase